jgi:acyl carrier protein
MQHSDIEQNVRDFVVTNFLFGQPLQLDPTDSLLEKGIIDSTGVLELIAFLESQYGIAMEDGEVVPENLDSLHNIAAFVARKLSVAV